MNWQKISKFAAALFLTHYLSNMPKIRCEKMNEICGIWLHILKYDSNFIRELEYHFFDSNGNLHLMMYKCFKFNFKFEITFETYDLFWNISRFNWILEILIYFVVNPTILKTMKKPFNCSPEIYTFPAYCHYWRNYK